MNYEHAYRALITPEKLPALKEQMTEFGIYSPAIIEALTIQTDGDLNYLYCPINLHEGWEQTPGMLDSTFVDFGDFLPEWKGEYYLSILFMARPDDYPFRRYMPYKAVLAHELLHLRQMIRRISADPGLIVRAKKYCFSAAKPKTALLSLRYEIEKILVMETEAHAQDWDLGIRHLIQCEKNDQAKAIEYHDKTMYIQQGISFYLQQRNGEFAGH